MTFHLCQVTGTLVAPDGTLLPEVQVQFLPAPVRARGVGQGTLAPHPVSVRTDPEARIDIALTPGVYTVRARTVAGREYPPFLVDVPAGTAATLADIIVHLPAPQSVYDAVASARSAGNAAERAGLRAEVAADAAAAARDAAELAVASNVVFGSRAAFEAAKVPAALESWSVLHAGRMLRYVRDPAGTAIQSANGIKGSPADEITPQHFGAVAGYSRGQPESTWTLDQLGVQAAVDHAGGIRGTVRLHGIYRVTRIVVPRGVVVRGEAYDRADNFFTPSGDGLFLRSNAGLPPGDAVVVLQPDPFGWSTHEGRLIGFFVHGNGDSNPGVHGILVNSAKGVMLQQLVVTRCAGDAIRVVTETGGGVARTANGVRIWDSRIINNYGIGINFTGGGENEVSRCYIGNNAGVNLRSVAGISVTGGIIADSAESGLMLVNRGNTVINGVKIQDNRRNGIVLSDSGSAVLGAISITGCMIADNGVDTAAPVNQRCGVRLEVGQAREVAISGNYIGNRRKPGDSQFSMTQQYGVLATSVMAQATVTGNSWGQNALSDIQAPSHKNFGHHVGALTTDAGFLHRYEEGSWEPELVFSGSNEGVSYNRRSGSYTIIGDRLMFTCELFLSSKGAASGTIRLLLPVATPPLSSGYSDRCGLSVWVSNLAVGLTVLGTTEPGTVTARIDKLVSSGVAQALTAGDLGHTSILRVSGQYPVVAV